MICCLRLIFEIHLFGSLSLQRERKLLHPVRILVLNSASYNIMRQKQYTFHQHKESSPGNTGRFWASSGPGCALAATSFPAGICLTGQKVSGPRNSIGQENSKHLRIEIGPEQAGRTSQKLDQSSSTMDWEDLALDIDQLPVFANDYNKKLQQEVRQLGCC